MRRHIACAVAVLAGVTTLPMGMAIGRTQEPHRFLQVDGIKTVCFGQEMEPGTTYLPGAHPEVLFITVQTATPERDARVCLTLDTARVPR